MAEPSKPQSPPPPQDLHWGIAYLREDIQDLRQDLRHEIGASNTSIRALSERTDESIRALGDRTDENLRFLHQRIDSRFAILVTIMIAMTGVIIAAIKI